MLKTTSLTKTIYNSHSQPINLFTPSTTSSSGSVCEAVDLSSICSSYKSNNTGNNDDINLNQQDESNISLLNYIDKLKRELVTVKQAKNQLASLYKVSSSIIIFLSMPKSLPMIKYIFVIFDCVLSSYVCITFVKSRKRTLDGGRCFSLPFF